MTETMKPTVCPHCGHTLPPAEYAPDVPHGLGEVVVCMGCQQITVATGDGCEVRKPTAFERRRDADWYACISRYAQSQRATGGATTCPAQRSRVHLRLVSDPPANG